MKRRLILTPVLVFLTSGLLFFGCSKDDGDDGYSGGNNPNNPPPASGNKVSITGSNFSPSTLTVNKGTTVTWTNNDSEPHTVTADDNSFSSETLNQGGVYSRTFSTPGTYPYHCNFHNGMTGSVVVRQ